MKAISLLCFLLVSATSLTDAIRFRFAAAPTPKAQLPWSRRTTKTTKTRGGAAPDKKAAAKVDTADKSTEKLNTFDLLLAVGGVVFNYGDDDDDDCWPGGSN